MSYLTVEVEIDSGRIPRKGGEALPEKETTGSFVLFNSSADN